MEVAPVARRQAVFSELAAEGKKNKVVLTCKQHRLERKVIRGNLIWNAEALFSVWLFFLLTTL